MKAFDMNDLRQIINQLDREEISMSKALEILNEKAESSLYRIAYLRPYLLRHPDAEMVRTACAHYLGDAVQEFINRTTSSAAVVAAFSRY